MRQLLDHRGFEVPPQGAPNGITRADLSALYEQILNITEASGLSPAGLLDLAIDSQGWEQLGGTPGAMMTGNARIDLVKRSRAAAVYDALSVEALRLWRIFTNGRGVTVKAEEPEAEKALDEFWNGTRNRCVFSTDGLNDNVDIRNQDGELIFAIFTGTQYGGTRVRTLETTEITGVVTTEEDGKTVVGYTREYTTKDNKQRKLFYWDIFFPEDMRTEAEGQIPSKLELQPNVVVFFNKANSRWARGNPLLTPALDWSKAFRKFMEARHAIQLAMATFVKKHKLDSGGAKAVAASLQYFTSGLSRGGSGTENNPPSSPGSVWTDGPGSDLQTIKQETGASSAQTDGDMLLQMFGVGLGLPPHYFGSGKSAGNLSVATTMELPILKMFQAEQKVYRTIYNVLIQYEFEQVGVPEDKRKVDIDFPEIVIKDVPALMQGLASAVTVAPRLAGTEVLEMLILSAFGIQDAAAVIEQLNADAESDDNNAGGQPGGDETQEAVTIAKTLRRFAEELRESQA